MDPQQAANELASTGIQVLKVFDSDVFNGAAVTSDAHNVDTLQALASVSRSWNSKKVKLAAPVARAETVKVPAAGVNAVVHSMTGVDKLHAAGILGKGAQVAVVDTGVWYPHPAVSKRQEAHGTLASRRDARLIF